LLTQPKQKAKFRAPVDVNGMLLVIAITFMSNKKSKKNCAHYFGCIFGQVCQDAM